MSQTTTRKAGNRGRVFAVGGVVFIIAAALITAGLMLWNSFSAASAASDTNKERTAATEAEFELRIKDDPGFKTFISDPVFNGPEWAAIVDAQAAKDSASFAPVIEGLRADVEANTFPPFTAIEMKPVDEAAEAWLAPMEKSAPLTAASLKTPLKEAFAEGINACSSESVDVYMATWADQLPDDGAAFTEVWKANAPVIIKAAANHICG